MIETPIQPAASSGQVAAPPPDARTRVMDPPPDAGARHEFACRHCSSPLHPDQAACLACGAMVENGDDGIGVRRAAVGSLTALLVLGGAVGAAVAGLPNGKHVGKAPIAQLFGQKPPTLPPATVSPSGGSGAGSSPVTPLAGSTATTPPPIHPVTPHPTKAPTHASTSSTTGSGSSSSSGGSSAGSKKKPSPPKHRTPSVNSNPTLFTLGTQPDDAGLLASGPQTNPDTVRNVRDYDATTSWTTSKVTAGVWVKVGSPPFKGVGVVSTTPHYGASLYYTKDSSPPADLSGTGWKKAGRTTSANPKQRFALSGDARNATYYLLVIDALPPGKNRVAIGEIQLLP